MAKRRQNGFKISTRGTFATHLRWENFISNEIVIYTIFLRSVIQFPYNSPYTQAVANTTHFELGEPVSIQEVNYLDNTWNFVSPDDFDDVEVILEQI